MSPPRAEPTGRVLGQVRPNPEARPNSLPPIERTIVIGGDRPPAPDPDELDEEEEAGGARMTSAPTATRPSAPAPPPPPPVDEQILEEARRKASQIVSEAQQQARKMLEETAVQTQEAARQAEEQARKKGHDAGYEEGLKSGREAAVAEFTDRLAQVRDMYVQIVKERRKVLSQVEPQLARLSVGIAEGIIGQELKLNQEAIVGIVREALGDIKDRERVSIRVHPEDVPIVTEQRTVFEKMVEGLKKFEVVSDATIDKGGCCIETNLGNTDARLNTQLEAIRSGIEELAHLREQELAQQVASVPVEVPGEPAPQPPSEPQAPLEQAAAPAPAAEPETAPPQPAEEEEAQDA